MNASNIRCLITAGPTREFFDPVRFISNPSSGKMGYAIADAAINQGWKVNIVSGPVSLPEPSRAIVYPVVTADEMFRRVDELFESCDILIMTAAVCDLRPKNYSESKVKKDALPTHAEFEPTIDILRTISKKKKDQILVGFAAETDDTVSNARQKMKDKNLDWIAANTIGQAGSGFESDNNLINLINNKGDTFTYGPDTKVNIANQMIQRIAESLSQNLNSAL